MDLLKEPIGKGKSTNEMQAIKFYENIDVYHNKVDKIMQLIRDYFDHRKMKCNKEFMAIRIINEKITDSTHELTEDIKERVGYWLRHDKIELDESIYTIEFFDKIFFCKIFDFENDNVVLAGYVLEETALVRTFMSRFSEKRILEKYEKILTII